MEGGGFTVCVAQMENDRRVFEGTNHCESSCGGRKCKEARAEEMDQKQDWKQTNKGNTALSHFPTVTH